MPNEQITVVETTETLVITETANNIVEVIQEVTNIVDVVAQGPQGPKGDTGSAGGTVTFIATSAIGGHRVVASSPTNSNEIVYADANNVAHANLIVGLTLNAADIGNDVVVTIAGEVTEPSWNWTLGQPIFLSTNGLLTQTVPNNAVADFSLIVGFPITATKMFVSIREPLFLI